MDIKKSSAAGADATSSIFDSGIFFAGIGGIALLAVALVIYFVDFVPGLSHLDVAVYSGATTGNYYSTVARAAGIAGATRGKIANIATSGSMDNIARLAGHGRGGAFALAQNGMPWGQGVELVAHLRSPETVFFIGPRADGIRAVADLKGLRIGIGPRGSGTAYLAESIFNTPLFSALGARLSHHGTDEQLDMLAKGKLDLGVFVISEKSAFMEKAVREMGMQIAGLRQCESISMRLPYLKTEYIAEGLYDPVRNLPPSRKKVLKVDTLLVSNGKAARSEVVGMLGVFSAIYPNLINYNRSVTNYTGLREAPGARDFFNNQGPEVLDRYAPRLMDIIPLGGLVQIAMAISIFFNLMGVGNRFFLWRIDANRFAMENRVREFFGAGLLPDEIAALDPMEAHGGAVARDRLDAIIARLASLEARCRKQSQSMLVPMGAEMAYRYQEEIIRKNIVALKAYRARLARGM